MPRAKYLHGKIIGWNSLLAFLETIQPWKSMIAESTQRIGELDDTFKRTVAAAAGTCTSNHRFPDNLLAVLDMIAHKRPKPFRWHGQIGPDRWREANSYAGALSGWFSELTADQAAAALLLDEDIVNRIYGYLGPERSALKIAMAKRYLCQLVHHLSGTTSLAIIGDEDKIPRREVRYQDFSRAWHWDGVRCERLQPTDKPIRDLEDVILGAGVCGVSFMDYLRLESSPICHQRILRHLEVAVYRIGSECGDPEGLPPGGGGAAQLHRLHADYVDALARWYDGRETPEAPEAKKVYDRIAKILGKPDERKRALIDCIGFRSRSAEDLQEATFTWLQSHGCTPLQAMDGTCEDNTP